MSLKKRKVSSTFDNLQKQEYVYRGPNHAANLNDMRLKDKYCDVTIKVDGKEIRAHKVILAANLKYFETMFSNDSFQESQDGVITMKSVEKAGLELFMSYAYTGEIILTDSNALNLLELANYLGEDGIKEACVELLEKHLKVEDACRAYKFANAIECLSLKNAAKAKIISNFGDCTKSAEYLNFHSESVIDILSDGKVQSIQMQKMLFEGIMKWIMHDAKDRKIHMESLLNSIDISKLKGDDVTSCLYKYIVHRNDEYGITKDAIIYYEATKIEKKNQEQVLMIMDATGSIQFYDFVEKKWTSQQEILEAAGHIQLYSTLNDQLYFIIDISGEHHLQAFDPSSKQLTRLHSPSSTLKCATLHACSRYLYICGGTKNNSTGRGSRSDQVLRYDPQNNSFETLTPMACERSTAYAIFYEGCLYVLGGNDDSSVHNSVEKYDPVKNEWTASATMCERRQGHTAAVLNGRLYACGGHSGLEFKSSVEVYDSATNRWQRVASMNKRRGCFLVVAHKDKLLAIGGDKERTVETYDPAKNQWQMVREMSSGLQIVCRAGGLLPSSCITNTQ